jgi:riboflavin kinase/FMN adenylyltransferase
VGDRRGRTLGFPTANLAPESELVPGHGVYATSVRLFEGERLGAGVHRGVTNIGVRPTFEPGRIGVETHLLDFTGDLYGRRIALDFHAHLRGERRFGGPDELKAQIALDAAQARRVLDAGAS